MFNPCATMRLVSCKRPRERIPTLPESLADIADKFFPFVQFLGFHKTRKVFPRFCELIESRGFLKVKDRRPVHARRTGKACARSPAYLRQTLARASGRRVTTCSHRQRILARRHSRGTVKETINLTRKKLNDTFNEDENYFRHFRK